MRGKQPVHDDPDKIFHPLQPLKSSEVKDRKKEVLQSKVYSEETIQYERRSVQEISEYVKERLNRLPEEHKRFENPHIYKVGISSKLMNLRNEIVTEITEKHKKGVNK